jgi:class 3 adenylate cyclase
MSRLQRKSTLVPEQVRTFPHGRIEVVSLDEFVVSHFIFQPGWRWSTDVKPIMQTPSCQLHHLGIVLGGRLQVVTDDGAEMRFGPGDAYEIPPGHDAWVEGDETWDVYEFTSGRVFALAPEEEDRQLVTLLFTDIVDSTGSLERLGDRRWRELLLTHNQLVRTAFDRFRGREVVTTGDGFLAVFDSPGRAVRCARAIVTGVADLRIAIRAGVHTGEVELVGGNVRGMSVHFAARVMALADAGEVCVSATTMQLSAGTDLRFESLGNQELKGISGRHEIFKLVG